MSVKEVSGANKKGKHTTVSRKLVALSEGGYVADTPGLKAKILSILYKCDIDYSNEKLHASFETDFENSFLSNASMYKGPTHMAQKYLTMI